MTQQPDLNQLSADQLRVLAAKLMASLAAKDRALTHSTALNDKLTHELAILKRHKYARRSEQLNTAQGSPIDLGGYFLPDEEKATASMRPSKLFNAALSSLG